MSKQKHERLSFPGAVEFRDLDPASAKPDTIGTIRGTAAVFETETRIGSIFGEFVERIDPGAFDGALARPDDVRALFNHDPSRVLGRNTAGTLRLSKTDHGLAYEIDVPDTPTGHEVRSLIRRGDISGSSFGFKLRAESDDDWDDEATPPVRTIRNVELYDVSPVTYPAYPETSVEARSRADEILTARQADTLTALHEEIESVPALRARLALRQALDEARMWTGE